MTQPDINPLVVQRLKMNDWSFGHLGVHSGIGTESCPYELHHHHDDYCRQPTIAELYAAGINPRDFKSRSRE